MHCIVVKRQRGSAVGTNSWTYAATRVNSLLKHASGKIQARVNRIVIVLLLIFFWSCRAKQKYLKKYKFFFFGKL